MFLNETVFKIAFCGFIELQYSFFSFVSETIFYVVWNSFIKLLFSCSKQTFAPCKSCATALLTHTGIFRWLNFSTFMWKYLHDTKNHIKNGFYFPCLVYRRHLLSLFVKCFRPGLFKKEMWLLEVIQGFLSQVSQSACTELPKNSKALYSFQLGYSHLLSNFGSQNLYTSINAKMPQARIFHGVPEVLKCFKYSINIIK